jgi:hypothetical protein
MNLVSHKIKVKKVWQLMTLCKQLETKIEESLNRYFQLHTDITVLRRMCSEPIFHLTEHKNSIDLMVDMQMDSILRNPVVVEVINLLYEGIYSVDVSLIEVGMSYHSLLNVETFSS